MPVSLLPFPQFYHLPFGSVVGDLPKTRDGVRFIAGHTIDKAFSAYAHLKIKDLNFHHKCTGICGLLHYGNFLDGTVRPHEQTLHTRLNRQEELVKADGGALGKPVLLTVPSMKGWWAEIKKTHCLHSHSLDFVGKQHRYELSSYGLESYHYEIQSKEYPLPVPPPLPSDGPLCIADGHHRAETHARLGAAGVPGFEYVPVCIIGADELTIGAFARLINDGQPLEALLPALSVYFDFEPIDKPLAPTRPGEWLMTRNDNYYRLVRKNRGPDAPIDVEWLEHTVLPAIFGITDTRSDDRITFEPVENTATGLMDFTPPPEHTCLLGFPLPTDTFFAEIEAGRLLPPKSTRFEPRVPSGLVIWKP